MTSKNTFTENLPEGWFITLSLDRGNTYYCDLYAHNVLVAEGIAAYRSKYPVSYIEPGSIKILRYTADVGEVRAKIHTVLSNKAMWDKAAIEKREQVEKQLADQARYEREKAAIEAVLC